MSDRNLAVRVIDSHTGGEPTRVVLSGGPELGSGPLPERVHRFKSEADEFRRMLIMEPRGSEAMVGALLCEPTDSTCAAGVIFFNNRGYLGMCCHGAIGVAVTLAHLGRIGPGFHKLETPVGVVAVNLIDAHHAAIENVPCYRLHAGVHIEVEGLGAVTGDVAWGGNWFFLTNDLPVPMVPRNVSSLTDAALRVRKELERQGICGVDGAPIDHIEFFCPSDSPEVDSRNFVLCPGGVYDRSPCGTGTSAKLACLAADQMLPPGKPWVQESLIGSRFVATYKPESQGRIIPTIEGSAYIYSEAQLLVQPGDPFTDGEMRC